jgi:predicted ribosome quality control (RQC) complex YloA/Tae2 family protein
MDNFLLQATANELEPLLVGQRLGKTVQLNTTDAAFDLRLRDGRWLVASTDPSRLGLYLTTRPPKQLSEEFRTDTAFVSLIKKYLSNAKVIALEKLGYDRVVNFEFEAENDVGQTLRRTLVVLLTGRAANVLLVEKGCVLARLRESNEAAADLDEYVEPAPPADKLDPFLCSAAQLYDLIAASDGDIATAAQTNFIGFSPVYARELAFRAQFTDPELALRNLLSDLFESNPVPAIYSTPSLEELKRDIGRGIQPDSFAHRTASPVRVGKNRFCRRQRSGGCLLHAARRTPPLRCPETKAQFAVQRQIEKAAHAGRQSAART